jgi:hypothetical protein
VAVARERVAVEAQRDTDMGGTSAGARVAPPALRWYAGLFSYWARDRATHSTVKTIKKTSVTYAKPISTPLSSGMPNCATRSVVA